MAFTILITGGIASGKSAFSEVFAKTGAQIIDTDVIAREITAPRGIAIHAIKQTFGEKVMVGNCLDRVKMRDIVFNNKDAKKLLEKILHPIINKQKKMLIANFSSALVVLQTPLFVETGALRDGVDKVITVESSIQKRINRLVEKRNMPVDMAKKIINSQAKSWQRMAVADEVVFNNGNFNQLKIVASYIYKKYQSEINKCS